MKKVNLKTIIKVAGLICTALIASTTKPMISVASGPAKHIAHALWLGKSSARNPLLHVPTLQRIPLGEGRALEIFPLSKNNQRRIEETRLLEDTFGIANHWFKTPSSRTDYTWVRAQITANYLPALAGVALYQNNSFLKKAYLAFLVTVPGFRTQKVGTHLVNYIIDQTGCQFIDLESAPDACDFYKKLGFVQSGNPQQFYFSKCMVPQTPTTYTVQVGKSL